MKNKKSAKVNIAIAMSVGFDVIKSKTAFSLMQATRDLNAHGIEYDFLMRMTCDIIGGRTGLVRDAIEKGFTHILFVDHDMFFPPEALRKLIEHDREIIGASYNKRRLPLESTAIPFTDVTPTDSVHKCQALGAGALLIKLSVFEKIPEPWFNFGRNEKAEMVWGEDTYFCQQAIKAGLDVWADPNLGVKHLGEFYY